MSISQPEFGVVIAENVMASMRDGVRLAADIYRPAQDGIPLDEPLPVLLERTPYQKRSPEAMERNGRYFARRGYVVMIQECRGCYASEGELDFLRQEGPDGYDTMAWIVRQPWCNGKIGTMGTSYSAWTQSALATLNPPGLAAMWVNEGGANAYTNSVRHGGCMELRMLCWAFWHAGLDYNAQIKQKPELEALFRNIDVREWLLKLPFGPGESPLSHIPHYERSALELLTHGDYDDFWKDPSWNFELHWGQHADVPMVFSGGWYDSYARATTENFAGLSCCKQGPVRLLMGPWTHGSTTMELSYAGDIDLGSAAAIDNNLERLCWFDHWLKGLDTGVGNGPPVKIFVMGGGDGRKNAEGRLNHGGHWRTESEWPLARTRHTPYYLHLDGSLKPSPPKEEEASSTYIFDPQNPVPSIGGNISSLATLKPIPLDIPSPSLLPVFMVRENILEPGGRDQRERPDIFGARPPYAPLALRTDILVFQTPSIEQDLEISGAITVHLWASSSTVDTDFTAKLIDVYPPNDDYPEGFALNLSDSIIRARYRNSWEHGEPLTPGEVERFTITLYPTSNLFQAGHRIRLDISSSNFPRFDVNPNTGEPLGRHTGTKTAHNVIYHDRAHSSHMVLPVIPLGP